MSSLESLIERLVGGVPGTARLPSHRAPELVLDEAKADAFEAFTRETVDAARVEAAYELPYPKHEYVRWLADARPVLFHGSFRERRDLIEPLRATSDVARDGRQRAVYATPWPLWAMWFAVLDRGTRRVWYTVNGSRAIDARDHADRLYWFKVNRRARGPDLLSTGVLYVLPREGFVSTTGWDWGDRGEPPEEWVARTSVRPLLALQVAPSDFPFAAALTS